MEDASRCYYDIHETYRFQDIESQFPMFFAYMYITGILLKEIMEGFFIVVS